MYSGLSLAEITSSDVTVNAVGDELMNYWPAERELLASLLEMMHVLVLTVQAAFGGKNLPKPLHVQRPWEGASVGGAQQRSAPPSKAPVISMSEFVARERRGEL
jgi:hypothetical protein